MLMIKQILLDKSLHHMLWTCPLWRFHFSTSLLCVVHLVCSWPEDDEHLQQIKTTFSESQEGLKTFRTFCTNLFFFTHCHIYIYGNLFALFFFFSTFSKTLKFYFADLTLHSTDFEWNHVNQVVQIGFLSVYSSLWLTAQNWYFCVILGNAHTCICWGVILWLRLNICQCAHGKATWVIGVGTSTDGGCQMNFVCI